MQQISKCENEKHIKGWLTWVLIPSFSWERSLDFRNIAQYVIGKMHSLCFWIHKCFSKFWHSKFGFIWAS